MSKIQVEISIDFSVVGFENLKDDDDITQEEIDKIAEQTKNDILETINEDLTTKLGLDTIYEKDINVKIIGKLME